MAWEFMWVFEPDRRALHQALLAARKRLPVQARDCDLSAELNAFCIVVSLTPREIEEIAQYADSSVHRASAHMAYVLAATGIRFTKE